MRVHINKALKTCCRAIQTALKKYNIAATALGCPPLDWKNISTYGSLAEFSLLNQAAALPLTQIQYVHFYIWVTANPVLVNILNHKVYFSHPLLTTVVVG